MGFFSSLNKTERPAWENVVDVPHLNEAINNDAKPRLFFKHSTRCSISSMALSSFERNWMKEEADCDLFFIDLLRNRDVSNELADKTGVVHQSPQVIVLRGNEVVYTATHSSINAQEIQKILKQG